MKNSILVIDDDVDMCVLLSRFLDRNGYEVDTSYSGEDGIAKFEQGKFDIVICDYRLGDMEGKDVLTEIKAHNPNTIVLIITGYSDIKIALDIIKLGAYDYITKPLIPTEVLNVLKSALSKHASLKVDNAGVLKKDNNTIIIEDGEFLIGRSKLSIELFRQIEIVANTDYSLILYGESGTGKKVTAKEIHNKSRRKKNTFITIDCGNLSKQLSAQDLLKYIEMANGGTLFLDEVACLPFELQTYLLKVIKERKYIKPGTTTDIPLDLRFIVSSHENLQEAYQQGRFIEELYYLFNEFSIHIPALKERKEDIVLFANFFLQKTSAELGKKITGFEKGIQEMFYNYIWPGNLRELRNVVRRAVLLCVDNVVTIETLPQEIVFMNDQLESYELSGEHKKMEPQILPMGKDFNLKEMTAKAEYDAIMKVLKDVNFNKTKAAEILNVDRKTLYNKIRTYQNTITGI
ncbi:MAG TPA: sigma-54 dependent transcriptional regulator [Ferruginibacter sp.]|nr:sigma-54 dependent transcriptional regulator [Ferruginibacter sp.]